MPKLGVALSVFDKIEHLETNINIIRDQWENEVFVSVCCNDEKSFDKVKKLKPDSFTTGNYNIASNPKPHRRLRIFDCIRNSILNCEADYIIHYHADAYIIDDQEVYKIINEMEAAGYYAAFRGKGLDYRNPKNICGDVDDHFCIFNRSKILESKIFSVDYQEMLTFLHIGNPETLLSKLLQENFNKNRILHYCDMSNNEVGTSTKDSFYPDNIMHRALTPYNFDNQRKFLHFGNVDRDFIIENLIKRGVKASLICV